ncbi:MAG: alanine--glyoxylate aminotransferase family protein [Ardenticatenales bacterium]|nr:alanine--glyoxylate aminotransferase family protein [Ardenticatenales bacterium]MCB9172534.1 alanine--glyoxylate aminotransferase family protein [Ardenticatenales bacterium]
MIPGPIEFEPDVLLAMARKTDSHVAPDFIDCFGRVLRNLREIFRAPNGQPFVVAGSGTLAMEMAAANLIEAGDRVLLLNTGYFGDRYATMLDRYGAEVTQLRAAVGSAPSLDEVEAALDAGAYKAMVVTHVDTSTGVRTDAEALARLARERGILTIFDGVCATAGERFEQAAWGADIYLTASQKAIGVPPGLALLVASERALDAWRRRREPPRSLYLDWAEWLPVMEAYEAGRPSYFGTPPVNLIYALDVSLRHLLDEGMEAVWARHRRLAEAARAAWAALGLRSVAEPGHEANTLSALYYPDGVDSTMLKAVAEAGVILAGGLHPDIKTRYFRVGHMGALRANDVLATIGAVEQGLIAAGAAISAGDGLAAAQRQLATSKR